MDLVEVVLSGVLAFGQPMSNAPQQTVKYAGLQVLHGDGAASLRLKEVSRETADGAEGAKHTVVALKDEHVLRTRILRRTRRRKSRRSASDDNYISMLSVHHPRTFPVNIRALSLL